MLVCVAIYRRYRAGPSIGHRPWLKSWRFWGWAIDWPPNRDWNHGLIFGKMIPWCQPIFAFTQYLFVVLKMSICAILHILWLIWYRLTSLTLQIESVKWRKGLRSRYHFGENETVLRVGHQLINDINKTTLILSCISNKGNNTKSIQNCWFN